MRSQLGTILREIGVPFRGRAFLHTASAASQSRVLDAEPLRRSTVKGRFCWTQRRWRYRAKGDPRFYYAPKGHTFETGHDAKPKPRDPATRIKFPSVKEYPTLDLRALYNEMKPQDKGRKAFKRQWQRWKRSMTDKLKAAEQRKAAVERRDAKLAANAALMKALEEDWEKRRKNLTLPPSLLNYVRTTMTSP